jgi:hypothetical protein
MPLSRKRKVKAKKQTPIVLRRSPRLRSSPPRGRSRRRSGPVMMVSINSAIPTDIKCDIARCVRAITWPHSEQDCLTRALLGQWVLGVLGFDAQLTLGSLLFRAGPDPSRDVCAFHGPNNTGMLHANGLMGHVWLEMDGEIIDFTAGDWNSIIAGDADIEETNFGDIVWTTQPPEFVWANKPLFDWKPVGAPRRGECWYGPFDGDPLDPSLISNIEPVLSASAEQIYENLKRLNLFDRCRAHRAAPKQICTTVQKGE